MSQSAAVLSLDEIIDALRCSVGVVRGLAGPALGADANVPILEGGLGLDSVMLMELITDIEQRLGFSFLDTDFRTRSFSSLRALAEIISSRLTNDVSAA